MSAIIIMAAQENWRQEFAALKMVLAPVAPENAYLHHIGSTAISGLAAKDVIDLQLTVMSLDSVDDGALAKAGFRRSFHNIDHCPSGLALDPGQLEKKFYKFEGRAANLHIRVTGRFNQRYALVCRDFLRSHRVAAQAYALIKTRLAQRFADDAAAYYAIKDPVFDLIVEGANEWAERVGWQEPPPD